MLDSITVTYQLTSKLFRNAYLCKCSAHVLMSWVIVESVQNSPPPPLCFLDREIQASATDTDPLGNHYFC